MRLWKPGYHVPLGKLSGRRACEARKDVPLLLRASTGLRTVGVESFKFRDANDSAPSHLLRSAPVCFVARHRGGLNNLVDNGRSLRSQSRQASRSRQLPRTPNHLPLAPGHQANLSLTQEMLSGLPDEKLKKLHLDRARPVL